MCLRDGKSGRGPVSSWWGSDRSTKRRRLRHMERGNSQILAGRGLQDPNAKEYQVEECDFQSSFQEPVLEISLQQCVFVHREVSEEDVQEIFEERLPVSGNIRLNVIEQELEFAAEDTAFAVPAGGRKDLHPLCVQGVGELNHARRLRDDALYLLKKRILWNPFVFYKGLWKLKEAAHWFGKGKEHVRVCPPKLQLYLAFQM